MLVFINQKATPKELKQMAEDFEGYIKVVVDLEKQILVGGGKRHVDAEQILLEKGSKQSDLWGGGYDLETCEIDYNSVINLRPKDNNPSRDLLDVTYRRHFDKIVKDLLEVQSV